MIRVWSDTKEFYMEYNKYTEDAIICDKMNGIIAVGKKSKLEKKLNKI